MIWLFAMRAPMHYRDSENAELVAAYTADGGLSWQHVELSMTDAVVSFLWADAAANEVLLESDGSQHSSFVAGFRPMRFEDGWGIVTPTSDADFAGMCKALDVEGYDDPARCMLLDCVNEQLLILGGR